MKPDQRFDVSVQTLIFRRDGSLFADLGTMRWPGVDEEVRQWFAGSCKTTAFWLMDFPRATGPESYTLRYRTVVTSDGKVVSDTTLLDFPWMTYTDTVRFERWALQQLHELLELFERQRGLMSEPTKPRSKIAAVCSFGWQVLRNKIKPEEPMDWVTLCWVLPVIAMLLFVGAFVIANITHR